MPDETTSQLTLPPAKVELAAVDRATLARLPKEVAAEFKAVFFSETETDLALGIVHPELLKKQANEALSALERQVGKRIRLFRLTEEDWRRVFALYDQPPVTPAKKEDAKPLSEGARPIPHYAPGGEVNDLLVTKVPLPYARRYRLLAVDQDEAADTVWFITDRPSDTVDSLLTLLARRNRFEPKLQTVDVKEFNRVLNIATVLAESLAPPKTPEVEEPTKPAKAESPSPSVSPDELAAEAEATIDKKAAGTVPSRILTGQVEQGGLAGLFQKATAALSRRNGQPAPAEAPTVAATSSTSEPSEERTGGLGPAPEAITPPKTDAGRLAMPTAVPLMGAKKPVLPVPPAPATPPPGRVPPPTKPTSTESKEPVKEPTKNDSESQTPVIEELAAISVGERVTSTGTDAEVNALFSRPVTDIKQLQLILRSASVPRMIAGIINFAVRQRASDIHLEPYSDELLVRYRVDGQLSEIIKLPMSVHPALVSRIKILSKLKLDESRIPQDGRFDVTIEEKREIDIRVSTLPTVHGEKVVMRLLDKSEGVYSLEKLGLEGAGFDMVVEAIKRAYGVVLSTGPTGSGKTTTLYAVLQRVATTNVNVVTLEDPVEYEMEGINQSQIKPKIGFTFADGLRSVLRQDPNIIMVGEIRDAETASMVTHSALTGHLVLSTLHTNDAVGALPRLINMGVEPFLITSAMNAIIGQRLVRRLCPTCRQPVELPETVRHEIDEELATVKKNNAKEAERIPSEMKFYRPVGCPECNNGYKGRIGLYEVMAMSNKIEDLAIKKAPAVDIRQQAMTDGMITMKQDGILKVLAGITSLDEVLRETSSR